MSFRHPRFRDAPRRSICAYRIPRLIRQADKGAAALRAKEAKVSSKISEARDAIDVANREAQQNFADAMAKFSGTRRTVIPAETAPTSFFEPEAPARTPFSYTQKDFDTLKRVMKNEEEALAKKEERKPNEITDEMVADRLSRIKRKEHQVILRIKDRSELAELAEESRKAELQEKLESRKERGTRTVEQQIADAKAEIKRLKKDEPNNEAALKTQRQLLRVAKKHLESIQLGTRIGTKASESNIHPHRKYTPPYRGTDPEISQMYTDRLYERNNSNDFRVNTEATGGIDQDAADARGAEIKKAVEALNRKAAGLPDAGRRKFIKSDRKSTRLNSSHT